MHLFREFKYDITGIGLQAVFIFSLPIVSSIIIIVSVGRVFNEAISILLFEMLNTYAAGYGAVLLMQTVFDTDGCELCFSYQRSSLYWGVLREIRFFVSYLMLLIIPTLLISLFIAVDFKETFLLLITQALATIGVGFLGITISKKVSVGLIVVLSFIVIQITLGQEFQLFNWIFLINGAELIYSVGSTNIQTFSGIIIGLFGLSFGQTFMQPKKNRN